MPTLTVNGTELYHEVVIGVAADGVMALGAQTAAAAAVQQLSCGDTITTDTTLHKDLINCPATAS
jgi:hypothetical protein